MAPTYSDLEKRCIAVINSCKTQEQLNAARNYLELYRRKEQDAKKYAILLDRLDSISQKLS